MALSDPQSHAGCSGFAQDEGNTSLRYAVRYSDLGWPVLPLWWVNQDASCACGKPDCGSPGKHPIGALAPNGLKNATGGRDILRAWFRKYPRANIGIATGAVSGIVVVDVDPRNGGNVTLEALEGQHGKLDTPLIAKTGGGGLHLFFKYDARPLPKELGKGIDLKGDGGYVVVEPSRTTGGYSFLDIDILTEAF